MKNATTIIACLTLSGCVVVSVDRRPERTTVFVGTILKDTGIAGVEAGHEHFRMDGYRGDTDAEAAGTIAGAAVREALKP